MLLVDVVSLFTVHRRGLVRFFFFETLKNAFASFFSPSASRFLSPLACVKRRGERARRHEEPRFARFSREEEKKTNNQKKP